MKERLLEVFNSLKSDIENKRKEFRENFKDREKVFKELIFCLLTPQSNANRCWKCVLEIERKGLLYKANFEELSKLISAVRFRNNKARYIIEVQGKKDEILDYIYKEKDNFNLREFLVDNVKGMGMKEATHFLRNIGKGEDLAILDRHILKAMIELDLINQLPKTLTKRKYLQLEEILRNFSEKIGIDMFSLDFVLWHIKSGRIFK